MSGKVIPRTVSEYHAAEIRRVGVSKAYQLHLLITRKMQTNHFPNTAGAGCWIHENPRHTNDSRKEHPSQTDLCRQESPRSAKTTYQGLAPYCYRDLTSSRPNFC